MSSLIKTTRGTLAPASSHTQKQGFFAGGVHNKGETGVVTVSSQGEGIMYLHPGEFYEMRYLEGYVRDEVTISTDANAMANFYFDKVGR